MREWNGNYCKIWILESWVKEAAPGELLGYTTMAACNIQEIICAINVVWVYVNSCETRGQWFL